MISCPAPFASQDPITFDTDVTSDYPAKCTRRLSSLRFAEGCSNTVSLGHNLQGKCNPLKLKIVQNSNLN